MERRTLAVLILMLGLVMGVVGDVLFYDKAIGLSFPILIVTSIVILLAAARPAKVRLNVRNLWPLLPALFFAGMVAVRGDTTITFLNVTGSLLLCGLVLHYLPLRRTVDEASLFEQVWASIASFVTPLFMPLGEVFDSWLWLRERRLRSGPVVPILRGIFIALPILVVFAVLLSAADEVFRSYLDQIWKFFSIENADQLVIHAVFIGCFAWLSAGVIGYGIGRRWQEKEALPEKPQQAKLNRPAEGEELPVIEFDFDEDEAAPRPAKRGGQFIQLGMIETGIILGSVAGMFAVFVLIQFAYFFGGEQTIDVQGLTYSSYARRGFFELVAVSVLTLGLVLSMDHVTVRHGKTQVTLFRVLSVIIVALTGVILFSASQRMLLYEQVYGFTHLRVYTHVSMLWIGVLLIAALLSVFRVRRNIFGLGVLLTCVGYLGMLNIINVDRYIADRNIERFYNGGALDLGFLRYLSVDSAPAIIEFYRNGTNPSEGREGAGQWLAQMLYELDLRRAGNGATIFSANQSFDSAWQMLDALRNDLPERDPGYFYSRPYYDIYEDF